MTFEKNIKAWLEYLAPGVPVYQAPYRGKHALTPPYVTFQVIAVVQQQRGWRVRYAAGKDTRYTHAEITVSVNVYNPKGYQILSAALQAQDDYDARIILKAGGVALNFADGGAINNLTGLGDTDYQSRYQCDLTFFADMTHERTRSLVTEWDLSGEFKTEDGSQTVPSSVKWP